jgi:hypothetical protein
MGFSSVPFALGVRDAIALTRRTLGGREASGMMVSESRRVANVSLPH